MREQMVSTNGNRKPGTAIEGIKEAATQGERAVTDVEMSAAWRRARDRAVEKLLSGKNSDTVQFAGAHQSFYATHKKPADHDSIVEEVGEGDDIVYIVATELK